MKSWIMSRTESFYTFCMYTCQITSFVSNCFLPCWSPLYIGFSRQEYWNGLPCPCPLYLLHTCKTNNTFVRNRQVRDIYYIWCSKWWGVTGKIMVSLTKFVSTDFSVPNYPSAVIRMSSFLLAHGITFNRIFMTCFRKEGWSGWKSEWLLVSNIFLNLSP